MKRLPFPLLLACLLLAGCHPADKVPGEKPTSAAAETPEKPGATAATFDPDKGLSIPQAMQASIGLTTAAVTRRNLAARRSVDFHVFRQADESAGEFSSYRSGSAYLSAFVPAADVSAAHRASWVGDDRKEAFLWKIDESTEAATGNAEVIVALPDPLASLHRMQSLSLTMKGSASPRLTVPREAVLATPEGKAVYRTEDGLFRRVPVETGAEDGTWTEIVSGLAEGDGVVVGGAKTLWLTELHLRDAAAP
jgi:hypothetical protein